MDVPFALAVRAILEAVTISVMLVVAFGLLGTWKAIRERSVPYLKGA
jgi:hypothetical protein